MDDLTPPERALCVAATAGRLLDLRPPRSDRTDAPLGHGWGADRHIRGQLVRQLLAADGELDGAYGVPRAVRLRGALVVGPLNLGGLSLRTPLELNECHLRHPLELANAEGPEVILRGSHLGRGMSARGLRLLRNLNLGAGFSARGRIDSAAPPSTATSSPSVPRSNTRAEPR